MTKDLAQTSHFPSGCSLFEESLLSLFFRDVSVLYTGTGAFLLPVLGINPSRRGYSFLRLSLVLVELFLFVPSTFSISSRALAPATL